MPLPPALAARLAKRGILKVGYFAFGSKQESLNIVIKCGLQIAHTGKILNLLGFESFF